MTEAVSSDGSHKAKPSPTLNTILMVEDTLKNSPDSVVTVAELKKMLPRQVNHNTLMVILDYLEQSNKIVVGLKGITWIHNRNENLRKAVAQGFEL
jgi:exosome complex RNA-binding protein Rrp4